MSSPEKTTADPARAKRSRGQPESVELARRFANRPDLLEVYERVRQQCSTGTDESASTVHSNRPADYNPRQRLLSERFTPDQLLEIVNAYRGGMKQREVTAKYAISAMALKRLLREHHARRRDT